MRMFSYEYPVDSIYSVNVRDSEYLQGRLVASLIDVQNISERGRQKVISRQKIFVDSELTPRQQATEPSSPQTPRSPSPPEGEAAEPAPSSDREPTEGTELERP